MATGSGLHHRPLDDDARSYVAPERDEELARQGDDGGLAFAPSAPCAWKTDFARSSPIVITSPMDASFVVVFNTSTLALRCRQGASTPSLSGANPFRRPATSKADSPKDRVGWRAVFGALPGSGPMNPPCDLPAR
jgi:hypothetical protein